MVVLFKVRNIFLKSTSKDEIVPVRMYLSNYDLTPTYNNINNKFSVKYYISLVLIDSNDRRYFK